jgi:hypothetical protein
MQHSRFVILTGHLNDYPLADLVGILRHQQKTGRLLIEYPKGPAIFYFKDGELVDAQLDNLTGLQAVCVAVAQPASAFNFNPLIQPSRRSIENSLQKVVSELLGCWDESGLEIESIAPQRAWSQPALASQRAPQPALLAAPASTFNAFPATRTDQALVFSSVALEVPKANYSRPVLAMAAAGLMMLGLSTVIAVTGGFGRKVSQFASSPSVPAPSGVVSERQNTDLPSTLPAIEVQEDSKVQREVAKGRENGGRSEQSGRQTARSPQQAETDTSLRSGKAPLAANVLTEKNQEKAQELAPKIQSVKVILRIENGRVAQASIANPRPGMDAYEALALRIARQRRYPPKAAGPETVMIKVTQSN